MNLNQLRFFTAIASCKSLSKAAKQLGVSQPALSKYLASLENELQLTLFYRDKREMHLTKAGRVYLKSAQKIIELENAIQSSIQNLQSENTHNLQIGVTPYEGILTMAELFPKFRSRFPQCELTLKEGCTFDLYRYVQEKNIDIALTTHLVSPFNLDFIPFFSREMVLCVPSDCTRTKDGLSPIIKSEPVQLKMFIDLPFVLLDEKTSIGAASKSLFERESLTPLVVYKSSNSCMVNQLVRAGMGCGFMPANMIVPDSEMEYFHLENPIYLEYGLLKHPYHSLSKTERYLVCELVKMEQNHQDTHFCKSELLDRIMKEFDTEPESAKRGMPYEH